MQIFEKDRFFMKNTGKAIFTITGITIFTKVLTFLAIMMYSTYFGADNTELKIYSYSLNMPNYIFTAIGTAITTIVIPIYSTLKARGENEKAKTFIDDALTISTAFVLILLLLSNVLIPLILNFTDYKNNLYEYNYAGNALRILLPIMIFNNVNFVFTGYLQSNQKFNLPAAVSITSSLAIIVYMLFFVEKFGVTGLIIATLIGFAMQPLILIPQVLKIGYRYKFSFNLKSPEIIKAAKLIPAILIGVSAYQLNMVYNNSLSTFFDTETLNYIVQNIVIIPILAFVYSITAVYYPRLSVEWDAKNEKAFKESLSEVINLLSFFLIPATFGLFLLKFNIIDLTSNWKNFGENNIVIAANMLGLYSLSIIFMALKEVFDKAFYAQKLTKPSANAGLIIMAANIIITYILKGRLKAYCIPVGYTLSCMAGSMSLFISLKKKIGVISGEISINMLKCFISACIMGITVYLCSKMLLNFSFGTDILNRIIRLFVPIFFGVGVYFVSAYLLKIKQSVVIFEMLKKLIKR